MHLALKTFLICILIGLSFGTFLYFTYDHRPIRIVMNVLSSVNIGSLMMLAIYRRHYVTAFTSYLGIKVLMMIIVLIICALAGSELTLWMQSLVSSDGYWPLTGGSIYILNTLIVLVTGIPIYASEEWKSTANSRILNQQYRLLQLEQQKTLFELEMLRAKINPHFLYNVHNTIAGLIATEPAKAEQLVLLLSKFFRFTLNKGSATFHTVSDELDIIITYLQMQQIRFGERLAYTIDGAPDTMQLQMPSFILQPLVENAVKHGIETSAGNGFVRVNVEQTGRHLVIKIADSGGPFSDAPNNGAGLKMINDKLKILYGNNYTLELNNSPEKNATLTIPITDNGLAGG